MKMSLLAIHGLVILILSGCTHSGSQLDNIEAPFKLLAFAVKKSLPIGKRKVSQNGREFYSQYFVKSRGKFMAAKSFPKRKYAHIQILGDRRPYTVVVEVIKEKRSGSDGISLIYHKDGYDRAFSKVIVRRIKNILSKRRDNTNVIDDFRIF